MKLLEFFLVTTATSAALFACNSENVRKNIDVELSEWAIKPSTVILKAGDVEFNASNKGSLTHEMVVIKTDLDANDFPIEDNKVLEEKAGKSIGEIDQSRLGPGVSSSETFTLSAGKYVLICNIADHYKNGMYAAFQVK